jgi:hypothetical protein
MHYPVSPGGEWFEGTRRHKTRKGEKRFQVEIKTDDKTYKRQGIGILRRELTPGERKRVRV